MFKRATLVLTLLLFVFSGLAWGQSSEKQESQKLPLKPDTSEEKTADSTAVKETEAKEIIEGKVIAYYFHSTRRCATCKKLEEYAREAIEGGFEDELENGTLEMKAVNTDEDENKHYIDDYKLYTKALILSRVNDGEEVEWVNLDKIWKLVGNEDKYKAYVTSGVEEFLGED
ncbi:MAG: hypothetical protein GF310_13305 [candidate division Zixibacteria bacterium]|nr:hypothetical protein [candidate division Zixibacteria bacterium]